jgi:hypothetical protein
MLQNKKMSSHYLYRIYNYLPYYHGYAYYVPQYVASYNQTTPYFVPPGDFYQPHYYYPRSDSEQISSVPCKASSDGKVYCPIGSTFTATKPVMCDFGNDRQVSAAPSKDQCQDPRRWPRDIIRTKTTYLD